LDIVQKVLSAIVGSNNQVIRLKKFSVTIVIAEEPGCILSCTPLTRIEAVLAAGILIQGGRFGMNQSAAMLGTSL
jgi:hypothetical protein